jgi:hypothetical protein
MGSGYYGSWGYPEAASILRMRVHDNSAMWKIPEWVDKFSDEYNCCSYEYIADYVKDREFYFGGPVRSIRCP